MNVEKGLRERPQRRFFMKNKKLFFLGMPVMVLVFGMTVVGCSSTPKSFQKGSGGETTILLRQGLDFDRAFREVAFILNRHGFESEAIQPEVGYIRTRWSFTWNDSGKTLEIYRVRVLCNFNPSRTQLIVKVEAEYRDGDDWISGFDTRAIETLRTDLNNAVGN
jgi:hypothetical protein